MKRHPLEATAMVPPPIRGGTRGTTGDMAPLALLDYDRPPFFADHMNGSGLVLEGAAFGVLAFGVPTPRRQEVDMNAENIALEMSGGRAASSALDPGGGVCTPCVAARLTWCASFFRRRRHLHDAASSRSVYGIGSREEGAR